MKPTQAFDKGFYDELNQVARLGEDHQTVLLKDNAYAYIINIVLFKIQRSEADSLFAILLQSLHVIPFEQ